MFCSGAGNYGDGHKGYCKKDGAAESIIYISTSQFGGIYRGKTRQESIKVGESGSIRPWRFGRAGKGDVTYSIKARYGYDCTSTGRIQINQ